MGDLLNLSFNDSVQCANGFASLLWLHLGRKDWWCLAVFRHQSDLVRIRKAWLLTSCSLVFWVKYLCESLLNPWPPPLLRVPSPCVSECDKCHDTHANRRSAYMSYTQSYLVYVFLVNLPSVCVCLLTAVLWLSLIISSRAGLISLRHSRCKCIFHLYWKCFGTKWLSHPEMIEDESSVIITYRNEVSCSFQWTFWMKGNWPLSRSLSVSLWFTKTKVQ